LKRKPRRLFNSSRIGRRTGLTLHLEARKKEHRKRAKEMGLTPSEYGLLKYAYVKADVSAKPDETVEQTRIRANRIYQKELQKERENEQKIIDAVMSLPEKYRKEFYRYSMRVSNDTSQI
jgi:hypothetical protein